VELIQWHDQFSVGVALIDEQHKQLFLLVNKLIHAVNTNKHSDVLDEIFQGVVDYTKFHFKTEEEIFKIHPQYETHYHIHKNFTDKVAEMWRQAQVDSAKNAYLLLDSLITWLKEHILKTDIACFSQLGYRPKDTIEDIQERLHLLTQKEKILVVDDSAIVRLQLRKHLELEGYEVIEATNGREALEIIDNNFSLRLIITDIQMPEMDGYELIKAIRERQLSAVYIIVITGTEDREALIKSLHLGANDFLSKPVFHQELSLRLKNSMQLLRLDSQDELIFSMAKLADCRSPETGMHLERVRKFTYFLGHHLIDGFPELGMTESIAVDISTASPLHDIGKVAVVDGILNKPGRLTPDEFNIMKEHAKVGGDLISNILRNKSSRKLRLAYELTMYHHEKWDGTGYPLGLKGTDIPLAARIMAIADVYDALTTERVYKTAMDRQEANDIIISSAGIHFDPVLVEAFKLLEEQFHRLRIELVDTSPPGQCSTDI